MIYMGVGGVRGKCPKTYRQFTPILGEMSSNIKTFPTLPPPPIWGGEKHPAFGLTYNHIVW